MEIDFFGKTCIVEALISLFCLLAFQIMCSFLIFDHYNLYFGAVLHLDNSPTLTLVIFLVRFFSWFVSCPQDLITIFCVVYASDQLSVILRNVFFSKLTRK